MDENITLPTILTVADVAKYLRVSETTVWRWCSSGLVPAFRIGRGWRIRQSDLEEYINRSFAGGDIDSNDLPEPDIIRTG